MRRIKVRNIGTQRKVNPQFVFVSGCLVILCNPLTYLAGCHTHYGVGVCIIVARAAEDLSPKISLFEDFAILFNGPFNDEPKERGVALTVSKVAAADDPLKLL